MKKLSLCLMTVILSLTFMPAGLKADAVSTPAAANKTAESAQANTLILRLNQIKAMDISKLSSPDKKQLRKEVRSITGELKSLAGGIYLSVGALIIIIILIIILL
jgi:hypothetical protein